MHKACNRRPVWQLVYYKLKDSYVGLNVHISCPECRHYATKCPECRHYATKCPECRHYATKCPECRHYATKCLECRHYATKCPECRHYATKCPECRHYATKCPNFRHYATKSAQEALENEANLQTHKTCSRKEINSRILPTPQFRIVRFPTCYPPTHTIILPGLSH